MATRDQKRRAVRERKLLRSQARWLQKALFALSKADADRAKLEELVGEAESLTVTIGKTSHDIEAVTDAIGAAVDERLAALRDSGRTGALMR